MNIKKSKLLGIGIAVTSIILSTGNVLALVTPIELPKLAGGTYVTPTGINNSGVVVGNGDGTDVLYENGIKWAAPYNSASVLGPLPGAPDNVHRVYGISNNGLAVGHSRASDYSTQAPVWDANGASMLPKLPKDFGGDGVEHTAYGISPSGQFIVGKENYGACVWENCGGAWTKTPFPVNWGANRYFNAGLAINDNGIAVGLSGSQNQPLIWEKVNGTWTESVLLVDGQAILGAAHAINNSGKIVGHSGLGYISTWEKDGNGVWQRTYMDGLAGYAHHSANDINESGVIVGTSGNAQWSGSSPYLTGDRAFIYDPINGMRDLNSLIDPNSGWVLKNAIGINDNGYIVGTGTLNGQAASFVLVPEPMTLGFIAMGLLGLISRKRR